jgi:hypothetical protein
MTQTIFNPAATSLPGAGHTGTDTEGPNIGAIIGGIAGGLVGVICALRETSCFDSGKQS